MGAGDLKLAVSVGLMSGVFKRLSSASSGPASLRGRAHRADRVRPLSLPSAVPSVRC